MNIPDDLLYTEEHEWVRVEDSEAVVGITDFAQSELGDVVYVELPEVGTRTKQMEPFGTIEAVKAVSDLYAPVSGKVIEVNEALADHPELVNKDPYGEGWMIRIEMDNPEELNNLLNAEAYRGLIGK
ncbi:MAG: glycine cleavage system protein GcvH [candidate division KSB1 bacterium]|nr:glycine cleavage system protein GcvH [candidate division KSB1 bacterium]